MPIALLVVAGCRMEVRLVPALIGESPVTDPAAIDPAWAPRFAERPSARPEDAVGFVLFERVLLVGEPATGLLRVNPARLPWRQRVHFEVRDELGVNLHGEGVVTVEPDETYLVQAPDLADPRRADQTVLLRARANVFLVDERVIVLPGPPQPPRPGARPGAWLTSWLAPKSGESNTMTTGGVYPAPLPAGPATPNDGPLCLVATPAEKVAAAAILWPMQPLDRVTSALVGIEPDVAPAPFLAEATVRMVDPGERAALPIGPDGVELRPAVSNVFLLTVAVPPDAPPGSHNATWTFRRGEQTVFSRSICLTVYDVPLPAPDAQAAATQDRYLAVAHAMLGVAARDGSFQVRLLADRIGRQLESAIRFYADRPAGSPLDAMLPPEQRFPFKLRWMVLHAIEQLRSAGVPLPAQP